MCKAYLSKFAENRSKNKLVRQDTVARAQGSCSLPVIGSYSTIFPLTGKYGYIFRLLSEFLASILNSSQEKPERPVALTKQKFKYPPGLFSYFANSFCLVSALRPISVPPDQSFLLGNQRSIDQLKNFVSWNMSNVICLPRKNYRALWNSFKIPNWIGVCEKSGKPGHPNSFISSWNKAVGGAKRRSNSLRLNWAGPHW